MTLPFNFNKLPPGLPNSALTVDAVSYISKDSEQFAEFVSSQHEQRSSQYDRWFEDVVQRDLKEKRKIAPGYLDTTNRILQPVKMETAASSTDELQHEHENASDVHKMNDIDQVFGRVTLHDTLKDVDP